MDLQTILSFAPVLVLLVLGYTVGRYREHRHIASIDRRELAMRDIGVANLRTIADPESVAQTVLVCGEAVIAADYFKTFIMGLKKIIGGGMPAYESMVMRGRREALLRLLDSARALGAHEVWNVRFEMPNIGGIQQQAGAVMVEVLAYGTAVVRRR